MKEQNSKAKKNKTNFIIPDFLNVPECVYLLDTFRAHKEIYKDNIDIIGLHGMFVGHSWNIRDKKFEMYTMDYDLLNKIKAKYNNEYNISLFITFDKEEISVKDLEDEYSNKVMEIFNDKKNYVICKSKRLADYIKETYKNVKVIADFEENSEQDNEYLLVNPKYNRSEFIKNYSNPEKLILIPDGGFIPNRRNLFHHSKKELVMKTINPKKDKYHSNKSALSFIEIQKQEEYLTFEDLIDYSNFGINTFVFSGIGVYNIAMYLNYIDYIYKEEYKADACNNFLFRLVQMKEQEVKAIHTFEL